MSKSKYKGIYITGKALDIWNKIPKNEKSKFVSQCLIEHENKLINISEFDKFSLDSLLIMAKSIVMKGKHEKEYKETLARFIVKFREIN